MASQNTADGPEAVDTISLAPVVANNGTINLRLNQAGLKSLDVEVLKVIDIPFTGIGLPPKILLKGFDSIGPYHRDDGFCKRINQALSLLPPLKASMARIFDVGGYKDGERLHKMQGAINSYLLETYPLLSLRRSVMDSFPGLDLPSSSQVDLRSLLFQWHSSERLYGDLENHYPVCTTTASWYQLGATKQRSSVLCLDYIQDKLIVISLNQDPKRENRPGFYPTFAPLFETWTRALEEGNRFTFTANGKRDEFVKLLLLDFLASSLYLQPSRIASIWLEGKVVTGECDLNRQWGDAREYLEELSRHEAVLRDMHSLKAAIDFICETLLSDFEHTGEAPMKRVARYRISMLQKICHQRLACATRSLEALNRAFEAQNKLHNIQESISVKRLTILATIFLPLSLSASILSMQSRFVDLGPKLYDFLGVFIIVGSAAILLLFLVRESGRLKKLADSESSDLASMLWTLLSPRRRWAARRDGRGRFVWAVFLYVSWFAFWAILFASFAIGMIEDVTLGAKVLGFGIAGVTGTFFTCLVGALVIVS